MFLREMAEYAYRSGYDVEVYHCAFDPTNIDLVVLPERKIAVLNCFPELDFDCDSLQELKYCERIDCSSCLEKNTLKNMNKRCGKHRTYLAGACREGFPI